MNNNPNTNLTPEQRHERDCQRMQTSIDQYRNELRQMEKEHIELTHHLQTLQAKFEAYGQATVNKNVRLLCSVAIADLGNIARQLGGIPTHRPHLVLYLQ